MYILGYELKQEERKLLARGIWYNFRNTFSNKKTIKLDWKIMDDYELYKEEEPGDFEKLDQLQGAKIKMKQYGKHQHDSCIVDYYFQIKPKGSTKWTKFDDTMSLMLGFRSYEGLTIK